MIAKYDILIRDTGERVMVVYSESRIIISVGDERQTLLTLSLQCATGYYGPFCDKREIIITTQLIALTSNSVWHVH